MRAYGEWRRRENRQEAEGTEQRPKPPKLLVGTRLVTVDGFEVLAYPTDRVAYGRLCRLLTQGNVRIKKGQKGECRLTFEDVLSASEGQMLIVLPPDAISPAFTEQLPRLVCAAPARTFLAGCLSIS
ncbi:MAG: hypothetical protein HC869_04415, partial [Rhodospirillales bacterium]|nr:hypothetical protein [Rhodospirillales bacterium]